MRTDLLLQLAHVAVCLALAWACLCRINKMSQDTTRPGIRAAYALLLADAVAVATLPMWLPDAWGRWASISLALGYLVVMAANSSGWKEGPPEHTRTGPGDFDDLPHAHWPSVVGRGKDTP